MGGNHLGIFSLDGGSGQLRVADPAGLNHERPGLQDGLYELTLQVSDNGMVEGAFQGNLTASTAVRVWVQDVNEAPLLAGTTFSLREQCARSGECSQLGALVGSLQARDVDVGQQAGLSYAIVAGGGGLFQLEAVGGEAMLRVGTLAGLDFEAQSSYSLTLAVTDSGVIQGVSRAPLTTYANVTVLLLDVDEAPQLQEGTLYVWENATAGTLVGRLHP